VSRLESSRRSIHGRTPRLGSDISRSNVYNYFRDYDPRIGRYIQSDPIGLAGGNNTFSYVDGDPLASHDSQGLRPDEENLGGKGGGFGSGSRPISFPNLKDHAGRHGEGMKPGEYLQDAINNIERGRAFNVRHGGEQKLCFVTRIGPDRFKFTSTDLDRSRIYTHMIDDTITTQYLSNKGITLPKGF